MRRKTKQIQQEEAALSILMDVHAEHAGQQLWQEFEQAQAPVPLPSSPIGRNESGGGPRG